MLRDLPDAVFITIAETLPNVHFWCTLAILSKSTNKIMTPIMYETIAFENDFGRLAKCCHTLASSTHLPPLVHSFRIGRIDYWSHSLAQREQFQADFLQSLTRMSSLRHLAYEMSGGFDAQACRALIHVAATLESLSVYLEDARRRGPQSLSLARLEGLQLNFPKLTALEIRNRYLPGYIRFFRQIAETNGSNIRKLSLGNCEDHEWISAFFAPEISWPLLDAFEITWPSYRTIPIAHTQTIRSLAIISDRIGFFGPEPLNPYAYPLLERIKCDYTVLWQVLMPDAAVPLRPVDTVVLTGVRNSRGVVDSLCSVEHSARTVTNVTLNIKTFDVDNFDLSAIATALRGICYLTIVPQKGVRNPDKFSKLGNDLFAHMPHLREFEIADSMLEHKFCLPYAEDRGMQLDLVRVWEKLCPDLARVAFTSKFSWKKRASVRVGRLEEEQSEVVWVAVCEV